MNASAHTKRYMVMYPDDISKPRGESKTLIYETNWYFNIILKVRNDSQFNKAWWGKRVQLHTVGKWYELGYWLS